MKASMDKNEAKLLKRRKQSSFDRSDEQNAHKSKEYKNLIKLESLNPTAQGSISTINQIVNFQDTELKELISFIG